ncbi:MAG: hypothetical protein AAGC60_04590 [Acidobacteriota bacterium]
MPTSPVTEESLAGRYRLAPGFHLVPADDGWLVYRPDGLFARLRVDPSLPAAVAALLADESTPDSVGLKQALPDEAALNGFFRALESEGVIVAIESEGERLALERRRELTRSTIAIDGDGPIATRLLELLRGGGLDAQRRPPSADLGSWPLDPPAPGTRMAVVCCAAWLSDARFTASDAWCVEHGVAWHGVYSEGARFHLGPFWLPDDPRTVRYADARARRLAADAHPDGLEAYWRYLDRGEAVAPPSPADSAESALIAGALASDLLAWARGERPPSHGHQLAFDRSSGRWRWHPVLPVPRGLLTEAMP